MPSSVARSDPPAPRPWERPLRIGFLLGCLGIVLVLTIPSAISNGSATSVTGAIGTPVSSDNPALELRAASQSLHGLGGLPGGCPTAGAGSVRCTVSAGSTRPNAAGTPVWTNLTSGAAPKVTQGSSMTYDAADGYVLLFGGDWTNDVTAYFSNETWSFRAGVWTNLTSTAGIPPQGRFGMGLAYDSADGYVLAFGGQTSWTCDGVPHPCADTWKFTGGRWTHLAPSCSFLGQGTGNCANTEFENGMGVGASVELVDDPANGYVLMATSGGNNSNWGGGGTGVWSYRAGVWTDWNYNGWNRTVLQTPRFGAIGYDPTDGYVVAFGNSGEHTGSDNFAYYLPNNATWRWANGSWINITSSAGPGPSPRYWGSATVDSTDGSLLLFGGIGYSCAVWSNYNCVNESVVTYLNDTWRFAGGHWTDLNDVIDTGVRNAYQLSVVDDPPDAGVLNFGSWVCLAPRCPGSTGVENDQSWLFSAAPPLVNLSVRASSSAIDAGTSISFTASFLGGTPPLAVSWNFGDGSTSTSVNTSHTFLANGTYGPTLWLNDSASHSLAASVRIQVDPALGVSVRVAPAPTDVGLATSFSAVLAGGTGPFSYSWLFGDGGRAADPGPSHTYSAPGNESVVVWVNDSGGASTVGTTTISVNPPLFMTAILASANPVDLGRPVNFSVHATGGTTPCSYSWSFGDGGTGGNLSNITHIYTTNGPFVAIASAHDAAGQSVQRILNMTISLNASIFSNASIGAAPLSVGFQSVVTGGTPSYSYAWQFGDGAQSTVANPTHRYVDPGTYLATLQVSDRDGRSTTGTWTENVAVGGGTLRVGLSASTTALPVGGIALLNASPSGGVGRYSLSWSGLPAGCSESTPTVLRCAPTVSGDYDVAVNVTDSQGSVAHASLVLHVGTGPIAGAWGGGVSGPVVGAVLVAVAAVAAVVGYMIAAGRRVRPPPPPLGPSGG